MPSTLKPEQQNRSFSRTQRPWARSSSFCAKKAPGCLRVITSAVHASPTGEPSDAGRRTSVKSLATVVAYDRRTTPRRGRYIRRGNIMTSSTFALLGMGLSLFAAPALANDFKPAMEGFYESEVRGWASDPVLVEAITTQNAVTGGYSDAEIDALDQAWRSEVGAAASPTISPVLENAAADFLRGRVAASGGRITEVFVMDARGLNVAASHVTSDYWQGDEAKHSETYGAGAGAVHFSEIELDESTQRYQGQISLTIVDPATGAPVGAMTIGVDAEALM